MKNILLFLIVFTLNNYVAFSQAETFGTPTGTTSFASASMNNLFSNSMVTYSGTGDIRPTTPSMGYPGATGGGNVFLTNNGSASLTVSNIGILNSAVSGNLCFGIYKSTIASDGSQLSIIYTNATGPSTISLPTGTGTAVWSKQCISLTFTGSPITVTFTNTASGSGTPQFRLDDISLSSTVLPIKLSTFDLKRVNKSAMISWSTENEKNSQSFIIERSIDGNRFEEIGKLYAAGYSNNKLIYKFEDLKPLKGDNYYRLKQVDIDGKITIYDIKHLFMPATQGLTLVNTVSSDAIDIISDLDNYSINVFSTVGQKMFEAQVLKGDYRLDVSTWPTGNYFITTNDSEGLKSFKIYKQ
jgi:hypothetical protein